MLNQKSNKRPNLSVSPTKPARKRRILHQNHHSRRQRPRAARAGVNHTTRTSTSLENSPGPGGEAGIPRPQNAGSNRAPCRPAAGD